MKRSILSFALTCMVLTSAHSAFGQTSYDWTAKIKTPSCIFANADGQGIYLRNPYLIFASQTYNLNCSSHFLQTYGSHTTTGNLGCKNTGKVRTCKEKGR